MIQSIPTFYNCIEFRSRLEARWAVFFDECGIEYQYEPEGYILSNGTKYLPDFYLPQFKCYAEMKPDTGEILHTDNGVSITYHPHYKTKWEPFSKEHTLIILVGPPHTKPFMRLPIHLKESIDNRCEFFKDTFYGWRFWFAPSSDNGDMYGGISEQVNTALKYKFEY